MRQAGQVLPSFNVKIWLSPVCDGLIRMVAVPATGRLISLPSIVQHTLVGSDMNRADSRLRMNSLAPCQPVGAGGGLVDSVTPRGWI